MSATPRHRVVVVGGGFGGLPATRLLVTRPTSTSRSSTSGTTTCSSPCSTRWPPASCRPGQISPVLRHKLRRRKNVEVVLSKVTGFDLERRVVHTVGLPGEDREYPYDSLIVAAGAGQSYFGHDEFALIAPGMKTIDDAMELRRRVYGALEIAETMTDRGAAAVLHDLRHRRRRADRRRAGRADPRAGVAEPDEGLPHHRSRRGPGDPDRRRQGTAGQLRRPPLGPCLQRAREDGRRAAHGPARRRRRPLRRRHRDRGGEKGRFECGTTIWAAGVQASPLAGMLAEATGAATDRAGRIAVLPGPHPARAPRGLRRR